MMNSGDDAPDSQGGKEKDLMTKPDQEKRAGLGAEPAGRTVFETQGLVDQSFFLVA